MTIPPVEDLSNSRVIPKTRAFTSGSRDLQVQCGDSRPRLCDRAQLDSLPMSLCAPCGDALPHLAKAYGIMKHWDSPTSPRGEGRHLIHVDKITNDKARFFFEHYGLTENDLERYLSAALSAGGDYADLYFEYLSSTSLMVEESMVKSASQGISAGCGVRVVSGERTGYAYTDDLSAGRILHAARTAALIASAPAKTTVAGFQKAAARSLYPVR